MIFRYCNSNGAVGTVLKNALQSDLETEKGNNIELVTTVTNHYNCVALFTIHYLFGKSTVIRQLLRASDYIILTKSARAESQTQTLSKQFFGQRQLLPAIQRTLERYEVCFCLSLSLSVMFMLV